MAAVELAVEHWGLVPYAEALARQEALVDRRWRGEVPDTLVLTEHPAVLTLGTRPGGEAHLRWSEQERTARQVEVFRLRRGGDVTAHNPGQIVGYPIVDLSGKRDLHRFLRDLEETLIRVLAARGLNAQRREGLTGVWLEDRKVAAIGVAVRHWVSWHGFALNVNNDLSLFESIVPCGIRDSHVTSLAAELGAPQDLETLRTLLEQQFRAVLGYPT